MSSNATIHTGFWTNYSKGTANGSTLTLSTLNGGVLIAALAIFIQLIGGQSWGIMSFIIHQSRTTILPRDALYHQQQAILRNNNSDLSSIWEFSRVGFAWRSHTLRPGRRSAVFVLTGLLHLIAFGAAGVLSSHMTTAGDEVLLARSFRCGPWSSDPELVNQTTLVSQLFEGSYGLESVQASQQYVHDCLVDSQSLPECNMFKQLQINWNLSTNASCPFGDLCLGQPNNALYMDTGIVDSRDVLGINSKDNERIQWRKTATCIPITTDGYSKNGTTYVLYDNDWYKGNASFNYTALFYGPLLNTNFSRWGFPDPDLINATYLYTNYANLAVPSYPRAIPDYIVESITSLDFDPIPALDIPDAGLTLVFATPLIPYTEPNDDLWLPAHRSKDITLVIYNDGSTEHRKVYIADQQVSVLACIEQQQMCNPTPLPNNTKTCTRLQPIFANLEDLDEVLNNSHQLEIATTLMGSLAWLTSLQYIASGAPLMARNLSPFGLSPPLSPIQWILEAENWFRVGLFNLQRLTVDFATGPPSRYSEFIPLNQWSNDTDLRWLCDSQIIKRRDYTNFHSLSIGLIFGFGVLVFVINQSLETVVGWVRLKWRSGRWRQRAWWADGTLQLQRRAFEGMGIQGWERDEWDNVPITEKGRVFSALRNWDEMLPVSGEQKQIITLGQTGGSTSEVAEKKSPIVRVTTVTSNTTSASSDSPRPKSV